MIPTNRQETSSVPLCLMNCLAYKVDLLTAFEFYQNLPSRGTTDRTPHPRAASPPQDAAEAPRDAASPVPQDPAAVPASTAHFFPVFCC